MSKIESGNWYESPWEPVREGIERVVIAMGSDSASCAVARVENGNEVNPHRHPHEQIAIVLQGECDYYVDGVPYRLKNGSWVLVPSNVEHYIHVHDSKEAVINMDIFLPSRPEYTESYTKFLAEKK